MFKRKKNIRTIVGIYKIEILSFGFSLLKILFGRWQRALCGTTSCTNRFNLSLVNLASGLCNCK